MKPIDFRSEALPISGYCVPGCRRNFTDEEKLALGLVIGSQDGLLLSEKNKVLDQQEIQLLNYLDQQRNLKVMIDEDEVSRLQVSPNSTVPVATTVFDDGPNKIGSETTSLCDDETKLIQNMEKSFRLKSNVHESSSSSSSSSPSSLTDLLQDSLIIQEDSSMEEMKKHQAQIGGRKKKEIQIPTLINKLNIEKRRRQKWKD